MSWSSFSSNTILLLVSLAANIALVIACSWLLVTAKSLYTDYRHFRALGIGASQATNTPAAAEREDEFTVVLFGDSRIESWKPIPVLADTTFINAGVSGETTTEMRRRLEHDVLRHSPDIVVIQAGVNDLTTAVTRGIKDPQLLISKMHTNMEYFISTLRDQNIRVVVTSIFPHSKYSVGRRLFWDNTLTSKIAQGNRAIETITIQASAHWLDVSSLFYDPEGKLQSNLYFDTLHINPIAYQLLNNRLTPLIDEINSL